MKNTIILILLLYFITLNICAAEESGATFLKIYPSARATSMGTAFTSIADNAFAMFYNPAGLAFQRDLDFSFDTKKWMFSNMYHRYLGLSLPIKNQFVFGASLIHMDYGEIKVYDFKDSLLDSYHTYDCAPAISIGQKISKFHSYGVTLKYIYSFFGRNYKFHSVAFDLGSLSSFSSRLGQSNIGFVVKNLGPRIKYISLSSPLPLSVRFGVSHRIDAKTLLPNYKSNTWWSDWFLKQSHITVSYDIHKDFYGNTNLKHAFGVEFTPIAFFSIRLGKYYVPNRQRTSTIIGYGIDLKFIKIDWCDDTGIYGDDIWFQKHKRLSITLNIGTPFLSDEGLLSLFKKH
jgi:hypothetical protein